MTVKQAHKVYKDNIKEINSIEDLPIEIQDKLSKLNDLKLTEAFLLGSYAEGHWCDKNSSEEFKLARKILRNKINYSDIDIYVKPYQKIEGFDVLPVMSRKSILIFRKDD